MTSTFPDNHHQSGDKPSPTPRQWWLLLAAAVALGLAVRIWAATQWPANFQSDEAVFGLMARHILAGDFTPTLYGPAYLGSIESIISAGFMSILGPSVMAFRMSTLLLFALFFVLHAVFTARYFGYPVALLSLLFLALPGFHVLEWTYQPVGAYGAMFVIGTLLLLVALPELSDPRSRALRSAATGVLLGLGFWANNTMILYLVAVGLVAFLCSPEWRTAYARLSQLAASVVMIPLAELLPVGVIGVAGLGVLTFFSGACSPEGLYATIGSMARTVLVVVCLAGAGYAFLISRRRRQLGLELGAVGVGFGAGYSPLLYQWIARGIPPYWAVYPSCPTGIASRTKLLVREILPALWGIPTYARLKQTAGIPLLVWLAVIGLTVAALCLFLWWNRVTVWRLLAFTPMDSRVRPLSMIILLFALPVLISILASNTVDLYSIRHALMAAQASAIIFALFLVWLLSKVRGSGVIIAAFWVLFVGLGNLAYANANWLVKFTRYDPRDVARLEQYLEENNIKYGYADYWGAYTLDYLIEEKTILAPFNGIERYLPYKDSVASAAKLAFVFPATNAPPPTGALNDLQSFLADAENPVGEGAAYPRIREQLKGQQVGSMARVAVWDVWIVADR
ncbi:MAG TPA: hypothetical protein VJK02_04615 [Anaerolineales bacterium]|nr:hypothetical protein [Anaerolineales bacterium]